MQSSRQRQVLRLLCRTVFALTLTCSPIFAESRVILISPHNEAIRYEFGRGFSGWHRKRFGEGAAVEWRDAGGTADALRFVQSEFVTKPDGIGIDIFFGGGSEPFLLLADKKLALPYQPPKEILSGIPQSLNGIEVYDAGHAWYGAALSSFGILLHEPVLQNGEARQRRAIPGVTGVVDFDAVKALRNAGQDFFRRLVRQRELFVGQQQKRFGAAAEKNVDADAARLGDELGLHEP